ncbi:unnamed protein product [Dicrocoelium dendriticum]|nr:unnamed protein product [Dicrocoelium dendriticum]
MQPNRSVTFDEVEAARTLSWIRSLPVPETTAEQMVNACKRIPSSIERVTEEMYAQCLSDGMLLGFVMAALDPSMCAKLDAMRTWKSSELDYLETALQRKRITVFIQYAKAVGVSPQDLFTVDQLNLRTDLGQVVRCLKSLQQLSESKSGYWASVGR